MAIQNILMAKLAQMNNDIMKGADEYIKALCDSIVKQNQIQHRMQIVQSVISADKNKITDVPQVYTLTDPYTKYTNIFHMKHGKLNGLYRIFDDKSKLISEAIYEDDDIIDRFIYNDDGSPNQVITLDKATQVYREISYHKTSRIISSIYHFHRYTGQYAAEPVEFSQAGIKQEIEVSAFLKGY